MREEIGKRVTEIRTNLHMKKNEFAIFLGITPQYLGTVESGENCLSVEKIITLAKKANVSTDYILLGKANIVDESMIKSILNLNEDNLENYFYTLKQITLLLKENSHV